MKTAVEDEARRRGESEAVVVRAALNAYLMKDDAGDAGLADKSQAPSAERNVSYKKSFRKQRKPAA